MLSSPRIIRIGTRASTLALWQANKVASQLQAIGYDYEIVPITSDGETDLVTPLYELGVEGIFTKQLDAHLLSGKVDIAVHSMKDVPVVLAKGLLEAAVLSRAAAEDVLVLKKVAPKNIEEKFIQEVHTIATSSLRRQAQWLSRYPHHKIENLRGNIQTRLEKLKNSNWDGALFAKAALKRLSLLETLPHLNLDWMLPAPAQGAIMVVCREHEEKQLINALQKINDIPTAICVNIERQFLRELRGGCTMPVGAYAEITEQQLHFTGNLFSLDGSKKCEVKIIKPVDKIHHLVGEAVKGILAQGGETIIKSFRYDK